MAERIYNLANIGAVVVRLLPNQLKFLPCWNDSFGRRTLFTAGACRPFGVPFIDINPKRSMPA